MIRAFPSTPTQVGKKLNAGEKFDCGVVDVPLKHMQGER